MSRSGYSDDYDNYGLWLGAVRRATKGYRGQHLLRQLREALDAMPEKRLITDAIKDENGDVCVLGVLDPNATSYDAEDLADHFGIARALAAEIVYKNDECGKRWERDDVKNDNGPPYISHGKWVHETPEERWTRMRAWVEKQIVPEETL